MSIGAATEFGDLLAGRQRTEDIIQALRDKRFRIDPLTNQIVMEGEEGYDQAATPDPRRSIFDILGLRGEGRLRFMSRRLSKVPPA